MPMSNIYDTATSNKFLVSVAKEKMPNMNSDMKKFLFFVQVLLDKVLVFNMVGTFTLVL